MGDFISSSSELYTQLAVNRERKNTPIMYIDVWKDTNIYILGCQESFVVFFQNFYFISFFKTTN